MVLRSQTILDNYPNNVVPAFTELTFAITHDTVSAALTAAYYIDYGDDLGEQELDNPLGIVHAFSTPGQHIVTGFLREASDEIEVRQS